MSELIILGKGATAPAVEDYWGQAKKPVLWTLNNVADKRSSLHFDVHEDRRFWRAYEKIPANWIVSPFAPVRELEPRMAAYPLREAHQVFGHAYYECTLDYMISLALLQMKRGQVRWRRICLPGCDMVDARHYTFRPGASFWLGVAKGMGIELGLPRFSALLKRVVDAPPSPHGDPEFPHAYGQTPESTGPVAERYGWLR